MWFLYVNRCEDEEEEGPMIGLSELKTINGKVKSVSDLTKGSNRAVFAQVSVCSINVWEIISMLYL
jgi:hypothetical protein